MSAEHSYARASDDGHPGYSTLSQFEAFAQSVITSVQNNPKLWADTAIQVTMDEGGGHYDSGYVQPVSFFGDGIRIPLVVVSPYTKAGTISHTYTDDTSIDKFIERNWGLPTLSSRSWDNLPNPVSSEANPYVPTNGPAVGDLFDLFDLFDFHGDGNGGGNGQGRSPAIGKAGFTPPGARGPVQPYLCTFHRELCGY